MKKITSLSLAILMVCSLILSLSGCGVSETAVIGTWKATNRNAYIFIYKDGSCRGLGVYSDPYHNWEIDGEYIVMYYNNGSLTTKYTVDGETLIDRSNQVVFTKVSDDPNMKTEFHEG